MLYRPVVVYRYLCLNFRGQVPLRGWCWARNRPVQKSRFDSVLCVPSARVPSEGSDLEALPNEGAQIIAVGEASNVGRPDMFGCAASAQLPALDAKSKCVANNKPSRAPLLQNFPKNAHIDSEVFVHVSKIVSEDGTSQSTASCHAQETQTATCSAMADGPCSIRKPERRRHSCVTGKTNASSRGQLVFRTQELVVRDSLLLHSGL